MRTTVVRLVDPLPQHGLLPAHDPTPVVMAKSSKWAGRQVRILLPAQEPNTLWNCGTRYVWHSAPEWLETYGFPTQPARAVCEHQIEID